MQTTTTLYYREGASDKVYQASLVPSGSGYLVTFAFGRRGSTLATGTKTPQPVPLAEAQKIHAKLIKDKKAKGYTEDTSGTPAPVMAPAANPAAPKSANLPMLLNSITATEAEKLLNDDRWCVQEKHDGKRMTLHSDGHRVEAFNKRGLPCAVPQPVVAAVLALGGPCILDGECVGEVFHAFDLLAAGEADLRRHSYSVRYDQLWQLLADSDFDQLRCTVTGDNNKAEFYNALRERNAEGIVFKDLHAPWRSGRPHSGGTALKFKFVETASCIVGGSRAGKRSVELLLLTGPNTPVTPRLVGNGTIPPNHAIPAPSTIVEVRYLYAYPGGSLFQPVYLGPRDDVAAEECTLAQLKLKAA